MSKFIISTDSSADLFKSYLKEKNVHYVIMKRIHNGHEIEEMFDNYDEFDAFYDTLKKGALPTTTLINSQEFKEYFEGILKTQKTGDIIHVGLSSGLSGTYENASAAAIEINKTLKDRKVYVVDTLMATIGVGYIVDKLIERRDAGMETKKAIEEIEYIRDHMQAWVIMDDLFHLKRGGRISGMKAVIGTLLKLKPIIILAKNGKLAIENKMKGGKKAIHYVLDKIKKLGVNARDDFFDNTMHVVRTSKSELFNDLKKAIVKEYPQVKIQEGAIGPIVGTHLGGGSAIVLFEGAKRLDIYQK